MYLHFLRANPVVSLLILGHVQARGDYGNGHGTSGAEHTHQSGLCYHEHVSQH